MPTRFILEILPVILKKFILRLLSTFEILAWFPSGTMDGISQAIHVVFFSSVETPFGISGIL